MSRLVAVVFVVVLAAGADGPPHLIFSRGIGTDWQPDAQRWMHFVAISADGMTMAADGSVPGSGSGGLGFWKLASGEFLRSVAASPVAISADFRFLATEDSVLDLQAGKTIFRTSRQPAILRNAAFSPGVQYVAVVEGGHPQISVLKTADGSAASAFGERYTAALAFHPDNQTLASGHWNNVTLWNARTGAKLAILASGPRPVDPTGYNRDGRYICGLAFSRDGTMLAAGSDDGELQIWDAATRKRLHSVKLGFGYVSNPAFSPDGKLVAAGTYADGAVSLVDVLSGKVLSQIQVSMFGCGSVAFSPDGQYLITPSNGGLLNNGRHAKGGSVRVFQVAR